MNSACAAEVDGAKRKCVYWITQHKDGGKGKNRSTLTRIGRGLEARGKRRGDTATRRIQLADCSGQQAATVLTRHLAGGTIDQRDKVYPICSICRLAVLFVVGFGFRIEELLEHLGGTLFIKFCSEFEAEQLTLQRSDIDLFWTSHGRSRHRKS